MRCPTPGRRRGSTVAPSTLSIPKLAVSFALPLAVGTLAGVATAEGIPVWHASLEPASRG